MNSGITTGMLDAATLALQKILRFDQAADTLLSAFFRERRQLGGRERGFVAETVYAVLRRRRLLEYLLAAEVTPRHLVLAALTRIAGRSQRQLAAAITSAEGEWLAAWRSRAEPDLPFAVQTDFPDWLLTRLLVHSDEQQVMQLARGLNQSAPLDLRVNTLSAQRAQILAQLASEGIAAQACPYSPLGVRLGEKPALQRHPLFLSGAIEVQDEGSQLLGFLLGPRRGEVVVDFCAGAGGKTLLLGAMMRSTGRLYAFDVAEKRLAKMKPRLARAGLSNVHTVRISGENDTHVKRLAGKVDRVLVDAPCSGLGTLRRNPDLKWRQTESSVEELTRKQADILAAASRMVKPGGRLVYATCSILREENEAIIERFSDAHPQFKPLSARAVLAEQGIEIDCGEAMHLYPHVHGCDGFFAQVMEKSQ